MAPTDEQGRVRVVLRGGTIEHDCYGWATSAPGNDYAPNGGYTVDWDDGVKDDETTRWFFSDTGMFDLEAV